jgi:hypothetical protein
MSIKIQLNSTYITVFTISIYVTLVKFYTLDDEGFNPLAGVRKVSHPKNLQMGSSSTQPPIGAPSPGVNSWSIKQITHTIYCSD